MIVEGVVRCALSACVAPSGGDGDVLGRVMLVDPKITLTQYEEPKPRKARHLADQLRYATERPPEVSPRPRRDRTSIIIASSVLMPVLTSASPDPSKDTSASIEVSFVTRSVRPSRSGGCPADILADVFAESASICARTARAKALNPDSQMWWPFSPRI